LALGSSMSDRYKDFPPGWGHLKIPIASRDQALAALALYSPCRRNARLIHRAAWLAIKLAGPGVLPGRAVPWQPALDPDLWNDLSALLRREIGAFDTVAGYERLQQSHPGFALLLLRGGTPVSFVKLRGGDGTAIANEYRAASAVARNTSDSSSSFSVPRPLLLGDFRGWHFLALEPLRPHLHSPAKNPPLGLVTAEIQDALADLPRPPGTPLHWRPMHGDCAPWNLRKTGAGLVLIDWEDAGWGPPGADEVFYRATESALGLGDAPASAYEEAIAYWTHKIVGRRDTKRDERLAVGIAAALRQMGGDSPRSYSRPMSERDSNRPDHAQIGTERVTRPRALVFAYACEPGRGSEPGAGWGLVQALAEFADGVVLTAPEHLPAIRRWQTTTPATALEFHEVVEPRWAPLARKHRVTWFLLYTVWLRRARAVGQRLHGAAPFDLAYHATYSTYWMASPVIDFEIPAIWGAVGGAVTTPLALWKYLGWRGIFDEILDFIGVRTMAMLPGTRRTWRQAAVRIVQNEATLAALPRELRPVTWLLNHALFTEVPSVAPCNRGRDIVLVSALESRKGVALALHALAHAPDVRLTIIGEGPQRASLERLARRLGVAPRVTFHGRVPRADVFHFVRTAAAAVFTGLREEGGIALAEAMICGAPVIVLGNGGARTLAAAATDPRRVALIEPGGPNDTARRMGEAMMRFSRNPSVASSPLLDRTAAEQVLRMVFNQAWRGTLDQEPRTGRSDPRADPEPVGR
jgi:glycosyltransferase involved in cell wall biosynthesis